MTAQAYARPELLASTEWLAERLDDPNVRGSMGEWANREDAPLEL